MAQIEPLTGDGWYNADDAKKGVTIDLLVSQLTYLHNNGNPRIGQAFTLMTYGSRTFHWVATPLVSIALILLVAAHALGRLPSPRSAKDGLVLLVGAAACFLAAPQPGHTFFYRPVTTNYLYTLVLSLAFFMPQRLDVRVRTVWGAAIGSALALALGVFIGKTNEHTGPTMILVAAAFTLHAWREGLRRDATWRGSATLGLLVGYLFLFFAPGQMRRYGALGRQSVIDTIIERGALGTADLLGEYCGYVGPLLFGLCLLGVLCVITAPRGTSLEQLASLKWTVAGYVAVSCLVLGTTLAAPKNHYRLFIAPAILLAIAAVAALRAADGRWAMTGLAVSSAFVCAGTMLIFVPMYTQIHEDELARNEILKNADPKRTVILPRTHHAKRSSYYYGDSLTADPRHRERMASLFGVREIQMMPKDAPKDAPQDKQKKKPAKKTAKAPGTTSLRTDPSPIELLEPVDRTAP